MSGPTYLCFDGMTWPNPADPSGVEWALRYGEPTREQLLAAASFIGAYRQLVSDTQARRNAKCRSIRAVASEVTPNASEDSCPGCGSLMRSYRRDVYRRSADAEIECDHSWHEEVTNGTADASEPDFGQVWLPRETVDAYDKLLTAKLSDS